MTALSCSDNKLTTLDLSGVPNLNSLDFSENAITAIDLKNLSKLESLYCNSAQLKELDLTPVPDLTILFCHEKKLATLDISGLKKLEYLSCSTNKLTTLDLSSAPNLRYLLCGDNLLTTLDIKKLTNLDLLGCYKNKLTALDTSGNKNLETLLCGNQRIDTLEAKMADGYFELNLGALPNVKSDLITDILCSDGSKLPEGYRFENGIVRIAKDARVVPLQYVYQTGFAGNLEVGSPLMNVHFAWSKLPTEPVTTPATSETEIPTTTVAPETDYVVLSEKESGIRVSGLPTVLPEDVRLVVEPQKVELETNERYSELASAKVYDIFFLKNNVKYMIEGKVKVEIPYEKPLVKEGLMVFYDDGTKLTQVKNVEVDDEKVSFVVDHFSVYVLANKKTPPVNVKPTGEQVGSAVIVGSLFLLVGIAIATITLRKRMAQR